jgi:hypothetical protein
MSERYARPLMHPRTLARVHAVGRIGIGTLQSAGRRGGRAWLRAGIVADAADLLATLRTRDFLPAAAVPPVAALAAASVLLGAWLQHTLD